MNTIKGMIEDLNNKDTHIGGCTTKGELIIALERLRMLNEQPTVEMAEDCISREQAQDIMARLLSDYLHDEDREKIENANAEIGELPSVTPQTRWIPCNERLPKENEYIGNVCKYYLIQDEYGDMHVAHLSNVGWIPMDSLKAIGDEIIAWRELPQSYKAESEDKE